MAFNIDNFDKLSAAARTGLPVWWTFKSATDAVATIEASAYFNLLGPLPTGNGFLTIGDYIVIQGSDTGDIARVTAISPNVTVSSNATTIAANSITNSQINSAAAIAYSKLASMATGQYLFGNAGVATAGAMSADATIDATGALTIAAGAITSSKIADTLLKYATVAITASEFNGMYAAPKLLVAAPGANKLLVLNNCQLLMTYNSAAYAAGGTAAVQYDSTANGAGVIASTTLANTTFQATASTAWNFNAGVVAETFTTCVNKGLYLSNITAAYTTGNSAMVAHVWYRIIPTV